MGQKGYHNPEFFGSVEILHIMKKLTELLRLEGGFTPSLSQPGKISFGQGSTAVFLKISEI